MDRTNDTDRIRGPAARPGTSPEICPDSARDRDRRDPADDSAPPTRTLLAPHRRHDPVTLDLGPATGSLAPPGGDGADTRDDGALAPPAVATAGGVGLDLRYADHGVIGRGGMGEIRKCRDRVIGREVAVKMVRGSTNPSRDTQLRFLREARVQGQLEHPAIVPVYDLASLPDGSPFFTMKIIRGRSLYSVLRALRAGDPDTRREYSRRRLLTAFSAACLAVDFAHARGVVHRDLKPGNIMFGDFGEVYVLDWGLARVQGEPDGVPSPVPATAGAAADDSAPTARPGTIRDDSGAAETVDGEVLGTPGYMAPEQVRGDLGAIDARTDVYALGAILFEILTLERLHAGDALAAVLASTIHGPDARPSRRAPGADIAPELDAVCVAATAVDPERRTPSARALSDAIERYLDGDRDLALRRTLARERADEARAAYERSRARDIDAAAEAAERGRAMRAVTAALGLDPECPDARSTLVRLLAEPPRQVPAEAEAEFAAADREQTRGAARLALAVYVAFALYIPFPFWLGLRSWPAFAAMAAAITACAALSLYYVRRPPREAAAPLPHLLFATLAVVSATTMLGPFVLVPLLAFANTMGYIAATGRRRRWVVMLAGCAAVLVPPALHWLEVLPASVRIEDGAVVVLPVMFDFPPVPTAVFLLVTSTALVVTGGLFAGRLRDGFIAVQRRLQIQAWQLRQLIPRPGPGEPAAGGDRARRPSQDRPQGRPRRGPG